jgi:hypothetical protein
MTALLKEQQNRMPSVHARRINNARWSAVAEKLREVLTENNAFKKWEVDAIVDSMLEAAQDVTPFTAESLAERLHSRQFKKEDARYLAEAIVKSYG